MYKYLLTVGKVELKLNRLGSWMLHSRGLSSRMAYEFWRGILKTSQLELTRWSSSFQGLLPFCSSFTLCQAEIFSTYRLVNCEMVLHGPGLLEYVTKGIMSLMYNFVLQVYFSKAYDVTIYTTCILHWKWCRLGLHGLHGLHGRLWVVGGLLGVVAGLLGRLLDVVNHGDIVIWKFLRHAIPSPRRRRGQDPSRGRGPFLRILEFGYTLEFGDKTWYSNTLDVSKHSARD